jgi:hypothetical protein
VLADYYSKWLIGDFSQPVDIEEMNRDAPQSGTPGTRRSTPVNEQQEER